MHTDNQNHTDRAMAIVYNCCFWFSLRLGGILIACFSLLQAVFSLIIVFIIKNNKDAVKDQIMLWIDHTDGVHVKEVMNTLKDPEHYSGYLIVTFSIYIIACFLYIYGAYTLNNILLAPYIILECLRLVALCTLTITGLLILKQNTMDIGLLIVVSVTAGFTLLGMFYLWICTVNLPVLKNEMERDEQMFLIEKLKRLVAQTTPRYYTSFNKQSQFSNGGTDNTTYYGRNNVFVVPRKRVMQPETKYNIF